MGQRTDTLRGLVIIITPLLEDVLDDLLCPSLDAPLPPLNQPEGTKNLKRPFDGWAAVRTRAGI